jgi:hypothetical protein
MAGYEVIIGSRVEQRACAMASELANIVHHARISGAESEIAAARAQIVVMTVPYAAQIETATSLLPHLAGKVLVDATVPLMPPRVSRVQLPEGGSAVAALQTLLGAGVKVVAAFQNVSAHHLKDLEHEVDCDVLICGDDIEACDTVIELANSMGVRGIYAGPVCNASAVEALTSVLITINRRYKVSGSGIRITGVGHTSEAFTKGNRH